MLHRQGRSSASLEGLDRGVAPSVTLHTAATDRAVTVAAAVASGVSESLRLGLEAAASVTAIAVEGSRNVVAHAYPPGEVGPLWMTIESPPETSADTHEVTIRFRDEGRGCSMWPTGADPPGFGLALLCELSEQTSIRSHRGRGTEIEATVSVDDFLLSEVAAARPASGESEIHFEGTALMGSVLPRAFAAHVEGPSATIDQIDAASKLGESIAADLSSPGGQAPLISVPDRPEQSDAPLLVRVGPMEGSEAEHLIDGLESSWSGRVGSLTLATEASDANRGVACISLDVSNP